MTIRLLPYPGRPATETYTWMRPLALSLLMLLADMLGGAWHPAQADMANKAFHVTGKALPDKKLTKARVGIMGHDDRRPLPPSLAPLQDRVGLLLYKRYDPQRKRWIVAGCTASCVAPHLLLTAAHCVMQVRDGKREGPVDLAHMIFILRPWDRHFRLRLLPRGKTAAERRALIRTGPGWRKGRVSHSLQDWAIIPLNETTPCPATLPVRPVRPDDPRILRKGRPLLAVGFQGEKLSQKDRRLYGAPCHATRQARFARRFKVLERRLGKRLLLHFCDLAKGASGGPLLVRIHGRPVIIGIISSTNLPKRQGRGNRGRRHKFSGLGAKINVATPATTFFQPLKEMIATYENGNARRLPPPPLEKRLLRDVEELIMRYGRF